MNTTSEPISVGCQRSLSKAEVAQQDLWGRITGEPSSPSPSLSQERISHVDSSAAHPCRLSHYSVPRYAAAQYNRTLHHPNLKQPTPDQEERHLIMLAERKQFKVSNGVEHYSSKEADLVTKLSEALLSNLDPTSSSTSSGESPTKSDLPSPTSTLFFPGHHESPLNNSSSNALSFESCDQDSFIGRCGLVSNEIEKLKYYDNFSSESQCANMQASTEEEYLHTGIDSKSSFEEMEPRLLSHSFVICADTQLGISSQNAEWETELEYSRRAVRLINSLNPPPQFVCICGDLIDMEYTFEEKKGYGHLFKTKNDCDEVQNKQNEDFQSVWRDIRPDIALVCLCGNHDIGNRPTPASIQRYTDTFGDEYLSFWANGTYNIVLNNVLFVDPSGAQKIFDEQLVWLEERLKYAHEHDAKMIFVFGHHPWFLYDENESPEDLTGVSPAPQEWRDPTKPIVNQVGFRDSYFSTPKQYRTVALKLFRKYGVNAAFSGHFHQNVISKASWGMDMIITAPLSIVFESTGKPNQTEANGRGVRIVQVQISPSSSGKFIDGRCYNSDALDESSAGWIRDGGNISHRFELI